MRRHGHEGVPRCSWIVLSAGRVGVRQFLSTRGPGPAHVVAAWARGLGSGIRRGSQALVGSSKVGALRSTVSPAVALPALRVQRRHQLPLPVHLRLFHVCIAISLLFRVIVLRRRLRYQGSYVYLGRRKGPPQPQPRASRVQCSRPGVGGVRTAHHVHLGRRRL